MVSLVIGFAGGSVVVSHAGSRVLTGHCAGRLAVPAAPVYSVQMADCIQRYSLAECVPWNSLGLGHANACYTCCSLQCQGDPSLLGCQRPVCAVVM